MHAPAINAALLSRLFLLSVLLALMPNAGANPYETTLANGMRVIVKEDHRAPTVAQVVWYRVGAMDETSGTTGVAHLLEHMMFKGTSAVGPGEFNRRVAAVGGQNNAFTTRDSTAYYEQVPAAALAEVMRLEADRMRHLTFDADEFARELKVVMEERRLRTDDQAQAKLAEQMRAVAFQAHPYRNPVIGWMSDLESMTVADVRAWYERWYVPNNALLVIVGDVRHEDVFALAAQTFGPLAPRELPLRRPQNEPEQAGIRRVTVQAPADLPVVLMAYKVPALRDIERDVDPYALEMLTAILDGHDAARLTRHLVREARVAQSAGVGYDATARGPSLFLLMGSPAEGRTRADLEAALRAEIARLVQQGVRADELQRAKAQLISGQVYRRDSMFAQAMEMGGLEMSGLRFDSTARLVEKLKAVTAEQIRAAAARYLVDGRLTVGELDPQPLPAPSGHAQAMSGSPDALPVHGEVP